MASKTSYFSNLFCKYIEQPKNKVSVKQEVTEVTEVREVREEKEEMQQSMVQTISGFFIPQDDAIMIVKKGRFVGWEKL